MPWIERNRDNGHETAITESGLRKRLEGNYTDIDEALDCARQSSGKYLLSTGFYDFKHEKDN